MTINIFKEKFGKDVSEFSSVKEIDEFIEKKTGKKLPVGDLEAIKIVDMEIPK